MTDGFTITVTGGFGFQEMDTIQIDKEVLVLLPFSDPRGVPFVIKNTLGEVIAKYKVLVKEES